MITILTLKFGDKYGPEYVNRLYYGVLHNTTVPFTFICYTDNSEKLDPRIQVIPIQEEDLQRYKGHWIKLKFHQRGFVESGSKCIFLDIDWVVTGNLDSILNYPLEPNTYVTVYRWWSNMRGICPMNSGLQMFYNGDTHHIFEEYFKKDKEYWPKYYWENKKIALKGAGEQNFIQEHLKIKQKFLPQEWFGKISSDNDVNRNIQELWTNLVNQYDPYLIDDQINSSIKMVHFTSNSSFDDYNINDNPIESHEWINEYWKDYD